MAERLAAIRPGLKVLYISGYTDDAMEPTGGLPPANMLFEKPFSQRALNGG